MAVDLEVQSVSKSFEAGPRRVDVLREVSFRLTAGESLAVTGPSGSGKSTLLHLIGTLDRPSSGTIRIGGTEPHALDEAALAAFRNRAIGFVFQDSHLLPQYTVLENVLVPALAGVRDGSAAPARALDLLKRVGLLDRIDHRPAELSGGERQRVAVARALIQRPGLLLCDEPTGSLDAANAEAVADLLFELHREEGGLFVAATHSVALAARFARRIELREGRCSPA